MDTTNLRAEMTKEPEDRAPGMFQALFRRALEHGAATTGVVIPEEWFSDNVSDKEDK